MGRFSQQKDASNKRLKTTSKTSSSKKINASQPKIDAHQVDMINPWPNSHAEDPDSLVLRNHDEFHGVQEISINYTSLGELLDHSTMVVNLCFSTMVVDLLNNPDPKTMIECK
jgi:hypothetical protein